MRAAADATRRSDDGRAAPRRWKRIGSKASGSGQFPGMWCENSGLTPTMVPAGWRSPESEIGMAAAASQWQLREVTARHRPAAPTLTSISEAMLTCRRSWRTERDARLDTPPVPSIPRRAIRDFTFKG